MNPAPCKISRAWFKDRRSLVVLRLEGNHVIVRVLPFDLAYEVVEINDDLEEDSDDRLTIRLGDSPPDIIVRGPLEVRFECGFEEADDDDD